METSTDVFIRQLTRQHRVVVLGGLAVIAHGLSRSTYDGDVWLDPMTKPLTMTTRRAVRHWAVYVDGELLPGLTPP
jgi:hypothetical protein